MNYTKWCRWMVALVVLSAGLPLRAQTPFVASPGFNVASPDESTAGTDPSDPILTIKKRVDEVNVLFIATDHHGKFVRNLNQGDFTILDDHKPPQSIVNFRRETDLPLELGLLVDTSGSVHSRFDFEQEAAVSFLQHTLRANFDKAFVMGFSTHSLVTQEFTDNVRLLETGVRNLHNGGGTAMYDAIYRACREKLSKDRGDHPVRRAIIVVSDGEDNQSEVVAGPGHRNGATLRSNYLCDFHRRQRPDPARRQGLAATGGRDRRARLFPLQDEGHQEFIRGH